MRTLSALISSIFLLLGLLGLVNETQTAEEYPVKPIICRRAERDCADHHGKGRYIKDKIERGIILHHSWPN